MKCVAEIEKTLFIKKGIQLFPFKVTHKKNANKAVFPSHVQDKNIITSRNSKKIYICNEWELFFASKTCVR